jgi:hypothetical protein
MEGDGRRGEEKVHPNLTTLQIIIMVLTAVLMCEWGERRLYFGQLLVSSPFPFVPNIH